MRWLRMFSKGATDLVSRACWLWNFVGEKSRGARQRCAWTCGYNGALAIQLNSVALERTMIRNPQNCKKASALGAAQIGRVQMFESRNDT